MTRPAIWFGIIAAVAGCGRLRFDAGEAPGDALDATDSVDATDAALPCISTNIADDFNDGIAAPLFMSYAGTGMTISEVNQQLVIHFASFVGAGQYAGYDTLAHYPLEGLCVVLHVIAAPLMPTVAYFKLRTTSSRQIEFFEATGELQLRTHSGPAGSVVENVANVPFSLHDHAFWRLRDQAGSAYWDTSSDGITFTQLGAAPGFFSEPDVIISVGGGAYSDATNAADVTFARISW